MNSSYKYRIKPDLSKFKVGDWVRSNEYSIIQLTEENVDSYNRHSQENFGKNKPVYTELWAPNVGQSYEHIMGVLNEN